MFALSTVILVGIAAIIAGIVLGALFTYKLSPQERAQKELADKLQQAEEKLINYQNDVSEHFAETSKLVNNLTKDYKEVYEHLAKSALYLANPDISRKLIEASKGTLSESITDEDASTDAEEYIQPPKDWAPKTPGATGTLSENFGLTSEEEEPVPVKDK